MIPAPGWSGPVKRLRWAVRDAEDNELTAEQHAACTGHVAWVEQDWVHDGQVHDDDLLDEIDLTWLTISAWVGPQFAHLGFRGSGRLNLHTNRAHRLLVAFVRTVKIASGAIAVQIVLSIRRGSRDLEHLGSAHDEA